jgi:hypothetical protein
MRDPELVARAQHAAARLESAWERWRKLQGLGDTPAQSVVGYVGYALNEPWGQPRAVIGFSADEAERLADYLERGNAASYQGYQPVPKAVPATVPQQPSESSSQVMTAKSQPDSVVVTSQLSGSQD